MEIKTFLVSLGLILDALGALLIFIFGISPKLDRDGSVCLAIGNDPKEKRKVEIYDFAANTGLLLLIFGFLLQLASNFSAKVSIDNRVILLVIYILLFTTFAVGIIFIIWKFLTKSKIKFEGQYLSYIEKESTSQVHFWRFKIINEGRKRIDFEFCLPYKIDYWEVIQTKKEKQILNDTQKTIITDFDPDDWIEIRIWNMGTYEGKDSYLVLKKDKIIYPKIHYSLD